MNDEYMKLVRAMITGEDPTGEYDVSALRSELKVHSYHWREGVQYWEVEFDSTFSAAAFRKLWRDQLRSFDLRPGDTVTDFYVPVTCELVLA